MCKIYIIHHLNQSQTKFLGCWVQSTDNWLSSKQNDAALAHLRNVHFVLIYLHDLLACLFEIAANACMCKFLFSRLWTFSQCSSKLYQEEHGWLLKKQGKFSFADPICFFPWLITCISQDFNRMEYTCFTSILAICQKKKYMIIHRYKVHVLLCCYWCIHVLAFQEVNVLPLKVTRQTASACIFIP